MLTQLELEKEMYAFGRNRAERMMTIHEEGGRANTNPYASAVYRRFVLPLSRMIKEDLEHKTAGRQKAHVVLLESLDPEAVAYLAVRSVINSLICAGTAYPTARSVVTDVGKAAYHELLLGLFETAEPALFHTLVNDLGRRMSKGERHRMTVFKMQAKANGVPFPEWGNGGIQQIGAYLVDQLRVLDMLETRHSTKVGNRVRQSIEIKLTPTLLELIAEIKEHVIETTPYYLPCVERPFDWISASCGGYHSTAMRRMQPFAVKSHGGWSEFEDHDMSQVLAGINAVQSTAWAINTKMLDTVRDVARHFDMEEILSQAEHPAPEKPEWLFGDLKVADMSAVQAEEFIAWKRVKAEWFTQMKLRGTKYGRFYTATRVADKFREYPELFFVYFADFRGRLYAQTMGVSPQGSDLQKALLRFATGKPLGDEDGVGWFLINGANKWGYDKVSLQDRCRWVREHHDMILSFATDPLSNRGWADASSPLQFLAWCMEYAEWVRSPNTFISYLPIGMDGSCNGLQNFSAMLRDEVGGVATNLTVTPLPQDIYQRVADLVAAKLATAEPDDGGYRNKWLAHGISRDLVKRPVMTKPYGCTRFACADFILEDYLKPGKAQEFPREDYGKATQYLSHLIWESIGEVVVKAEQAMDWLQDAARIIMKRGEQVIRWKAPTGFPVAQFYQEQENHRIRTRLCGNAFLRLTRDTEKPHKAHHRNGIAPNFIHSFDAAHMTLVAREAGAAGLSLAMIHDDFGTHAADAAALYKIIRSTFVEMYENCTPLEDLAAAYDLPPPPERGSLDLSLVHQSPYFFS